jgi:fatty acid desaturase
MQKEEIEQIKKWRDQRLKRGEGPDFLKKFLVKKYGEEVFDQVMQSYDLNWLKKFKKDKEKEKKLGGYVTLISIALLGLFMFLILFYSNSQISSISGDNKLEGFELLDGLINAINIGAWISLGVFVVFALLIIAKIIKDKEASFGKENEKRN